MSKRTASEIRAYCEAATEGPWDAIEQYGVYAGNYVIRQSEEKGPLKSFIEVCGPKDIGSHRTDAQSNADFIVNARADMLRLLEAAVKLREALLLTRGSAYDMGRYVCGRKADDVLGETEWLKEGDDGGA